MTAEKQMIRLNLSQTQILMTEQVCPGTARNTISLKLHLPEHSPGEVKAAADAVLDSGDIFAVSLCRREGEWMLSRMERKISECRIGKEQAADLAEEYMAAKDRQPFPMEECLYQAEVIPLSGGGVFLYVRFHHVIIDGYGMSLFVQKTMDVLAGKQIAPSIFFPENLTVPETVHGSGGTEEEAAGGDGRAEREVAGGDGRAEKEAASGSGCTGERTGGDGQEDGFWRSFFDGAEYEGAVFPQKADGKGSDGSRSGRNRFGSCRVSVPEQLKRETEAFGKRENISIPYIFAASYALYLSRSTGKRDAVFLMPRLNRTSGQMDTLGCYTLLVPVRVQVEGAETFGELCRRVKRASVEASAHKECGFDRILSVLRNENMTGESLSEYVFNFYRFSFGADFPYSVRFSVAGEMSNHLTFNIFRNEKEGLDLQADYLETVYTEERAEYFCDAILAIAAQGTADSQREFSDAAGTADSQREFLDAAGIAGSQGAFSDAAGVEGRTVQKLSDIRTVGEAEYRKITSVAGKTIPIDKSLTIPSLFRRAAEKYRDAPALYAGEYAFTFGQLDEISDRIACGLRRLGVKSGHKVAFLLKRDYRLIPTILGISKAGAAFIPADPAYPPDRISYIMENSQAACLISSGDVEIAGNYEYTEIDTLLSQEVEPALLPEIGQDDLAYMIYTSGTTGRPKGVMLSHRGIANIVHPDNNPFNRDITGNCHGIVAIGSICFDISLFEIFVPLMNGLFVELGNEKSMMDAGELSAHILRHGADILHCTPSRITAYLANDAFRKALEGVKAILAAGEVLPGSLVKRLEETCQIRIYNGYGPTETTIGATITEAGDAVSIGTPIANTGILLLNGESEPVPFGAVGEICIYGNGVGIGYQGRPEETEAKYMIWGGIRLYRTGDLGYFSSDGRLIYCGRNDRQVKLRGLRIELSEIENVMGEFPGVSACCCMIRKIEKTGHLVGFYTSIPKGSVNQEALKAHMKARLTAYMVPDVLKELDAMPQTPNGKTDQKALEREPVAYIRIYRKPETEREKLVCSAFGEVLSIGQVGLDDNFFELGGDSLNAVAVILKIEEKLGLAENQPDSGSGGTGGRGSVCRPASSGKLEYGDLYRYPTPALLLERIFKKTDGGPDKGFDIESLDYQGMAQYLTAHTRNEARRRHLGNVLLTGATGYLGIHILVDLLRNPDWCGKIVCLSRPKKTLTALKRVKSSLFYYAEEDFSASYGDKWLVVEGDITLSDIFARECPFHIHTIINSAADVSHFSYGDHLEKINTQGVRNLIRFAEKEQAMLCQISTISVAGMTAGEIRKEGFCESDFYIGQEIHNQYIYSKYMAEYEMLRAAVRDGLEIKIMRIGNLQGRIRDGEFQMNLHSNAFTRQFSSYIKLGAAPLSVYEGSVNFSPVDETAHNIAVLAATGGETAVFHVYPPVELKFADLFRAAGRLGYTVEALPDEEFSELLRERKQSAEGREQLQGLMTSEEAGNLCEIPVVQELTDGYLQSLSEGWSDITEAYLDKYLSALSGMDLF